MGDIIRTTEGPTDIDHEHTENAGKPTPKLQIVTRKIRPLSVQDAKQAIATPGGHPNSPVRLASLMRYAYEADGERDDYTLLPDEAADVALHTETWVMRHRARVSHLIHDSVELKYLTDGTKQYESQYEWLDNAVRINRMLSLYSEAKFVDSAVRVVLLDALEPGWE